MSGSCHLDRASNIEIGVECQIFVIVIFFHCGQVLQFGAHSRYYKGALTQKRSFLVIWTTFRSDFHVSWKYQNKHSTLNSSFDALSKWHEPDQSHVNRIDDLIFSMTPNIGFQNVVKTCHFSHLDVLYIIFIYNLQLL